MDDLYGNAWSDADGQASTSQTLKLSRSGSWTPPKLSLTVQDDEADLAAPPWSTGAGLSWNEPSDATGHSWSQSDANAGWGASTYEGIEIKSTPQLELDEVPRTVSPDEESPPQKTEYHPVDEECAPDSQDSPCAPDASTAARLPDLPASPHTDGDGFGVFESALGPATADVVSPEILNSPEVTGAWGSPWAGGPSHDVSRGEENVDEWETARRQKEIRDRRVPPEIVDFILQQCNDFCTEAYPPSENSELPSEKDSWRDDFRSGMEGVEGLESFMQMFLPSLSLEPSPKFGKTSIAKKMAHSVKLTKHLPLTKESPMAHYLAARGSLAWEAAVKGSKDVVEEDVIPVGWRILEKETTTASTSSTDGQKQPSRFFSFWSRRQSGISPARTPSDRSKSPSGSVQETSHSRQGSQDSAKTSKRLSTDQAFASPIKEQAMSSTSIKSQSVASPSLLTSPSSATASQTLSYADAPEPHVQIVQSEPASSAVSRFLNQFSRRSSTHGPRSTRDSLALSSDDLEFLSDIPSASDGDEDTVPIASLAKTLKPEPLPPILPPPPSAPPTIPSVISSAASASTQSLAGFSPAASGPTAELSSLESFFTPLENAQPPAPRTETLGIHPIVVTETAGISRSITPTLPFPLGGYRSGSRPLSPSPLSSGTSPTTAKPAQPFYLPSPPSSRSQTPIISPPASTLTDMPPSAGLRVVTVNPATVPVTTTHGALSASSTSTSSQSPGTPLSTKPLGELYPTAARTSSPPPPQPARISSPMSSFMIPPPPAANSQPSTHYGVPILTPPPRASPTTSMGATAAKTPTPVVNILDDDSFSDFQSSPATAFPRPPRNALSLSTRQPPPPALSLSSMQSSALLFDDDDFSDFHSSLPQSTSLQPDASQSFVSTSKIKTSTSDTAFFTPRKTSTSGFSLTSDGSPILPSPSPPRLPFKATTPARFKSTPTSDGSPSHARKRSKAEEEQHTRELMQRAAARTGRWPAPASPLPQTLSFLPPPPPSGSANKIALLDLMGDDGDNSGPTALPMSTSVSSPVSMGSTRLMPLSSLSQSQSLQGIGAPQSVQKPALSANVGADMFAHWPAAARTSSATTPTPQAALKKLGGLSAQDLSFFEGS